MIDYPHTEPLVDQLLSSPTVSKIETVATTPTLRVPPITKDNTAPEAPTPQKTPTLSIPQPPPRPKSPDLYREPVK